ncbi:hypothetical protein [Phenylobacterium sp.]|uniref:hypothetical protein n=1 Tax=Phenylobacterium sp. TaxID=1871053 RepID=UPI00273216C1|nr:hypothetical protein [Phenylobacterium sp.]MDP1874318.1 hypothetical protein [Phenylobacterium sp.]MDP3489311.1 hypothetical protein [Phenylobacterium sp.]
MKRLLCATAALVLAATGAVAQTTEAAPPPAAEAQPLAAHPAAEAPAAAPTAPLAPVVDPNVYQVLRSGDRAMSCEQIGAEANTLNAQLMAEQAEAAKQAQRAKQGRGMAGGLASGVLGGAARYGLARGMVGGAFSPFAAQALSAVADSSSQAVGQAVAAGGEVAAPSVSPQQQRMNHLLGLYREKAC